MGLAFAPKYFSFKLYFIYFFGPRGTAEMLMFPFPLYSFHCLKGPTRGNATVETGSEAVLQISLRGLLKQERLRSGCSPH